jgi:hypothetical protein
MTIGSSFENLYIGLNYDTTIILSVTVACAPDKQCTAWNATPKPAQNCPSLRQRKS